MKRPPYLENVEHAAVTLRLLGVMAVLLDDAAGSKVGPSPHLLFEKFLETVSGTSTSKSCLYVAGLHIRGALLTARSRNDSSCHTYLSMFYNTTKWYVTVN
jgi:hypothetical protein